MENKISIRFFNDTPVRAVWNEKTNTWFFSVLDVISVIRNEPNYEKNRNYWKYLKAKLKKENSQLVSATTQLKITANDGKKYLSDTLNANGIIDLASEFPSKIGSKFIERFTRSEDTIDGKSKQKAYDLLDKYVEMNVAHPFMEGNGRSTRIWLDLMLKKNLGKCVDWSLINKKEYLDAMKKSVADSTDIKKLIKFALTNKIDDREVFMKGVDYSYYYEESE